MASVNGHQGLWLLDTGGPIVLVNREYLRPATHGVGLDTIDTPYIEDSALAAGKIESPPDWVADSVTVQLGSLVLHLTSADAGQTPMIAAAIPLPRLFEKYWGFKPLGILGVAAVFGAYETVMNYTRQQLTLIPLGAKGQRIAAMPAYTPSQVVSFTSTSSVNRGWYIVTQLGGVTDTLHIDTGEAYNKIHAPIRPQLQPHLTPTGRTVFDDLRQEPVMTLDHLVFAGKTFDTVAFSVTPDRADALGTELLQRLGVIGFNFRARQFLVYR